MAGPSRRKKKSGLLPKILHRPSFRQRSASKALNTSQHPPGSNSLPPNDAPSTSAPVPHQAGNTDEYAAISGIPTMPLDGLTPGQRMKERGSTAYQGLIAVVQALSDCSDIFLPLKAACNVILTVHKTIDVRTIHLLYMREIYISPVPRGCRQIETNLKNWKSSSKPSFQSSTSISNTAG